MDKIELNLKGYLWYSKWNFKGHFEIQNEIHKPYIEKKDLYSKLKLLEMAPC